jgi:parallel beta-helix repeat protein
MNDLPRRKLRELVARDGRLIAENSLRSESLLRDYCGEFRREISVLVMALEEHAVDDMLSAPKSLPRQVLFGRLAQRLCDNLALSESAARWSIESWALAFGLITEKELSASITEQAKKQNPPEPTASVSQKTAKPVTPPASQPKQTASTQTAPTQTAKVATASYVVSANGGGNFASISEALRTVASGSRLLIREGFYNESILLDKQIEIVGDGAFENIIVESANSSCVSMQTDRATIRGLTLNGVGKQNGKSFFAVDIPRGELILEGCSITSDSLSCIAIHGGGANPLIKNCLVHDGADSGFYIFDNARGRIEESDVYHNKNVGVAITGGANPAIKKCRIFEGDNGGIVVWQNGAAGLIEDCEILGHRLANVGVSEYANPIFRRCKIFGGRDSGVFVHQNGYGTFEECDIYNNAKAEVALSQNKNTVFRNCRIHDGASSGVLVQNQGRALIENCDVYDNNDAGVAIYGSSIAAIRNCNINRNRVVAVRVKESSAASVENCDLRGNRVATWETEGDVVVERKNNRE